MYLKYYIYNHIYISIYIHIYRDNIIYVYMIRIYVSTNSNIYIYIYIACHIIRIVEVPISPALIWTARVPKPRWNLRKSWALSWAGVVNQGFGISNEQECHGKCHGKCHGMPCLQGLDGVETYGKMQKVLTCQENFKSFSNLAGTPREQLVIDRRSHQACQAVRGLLIIFLAMRDQHTTFLIHSFTLAISIWT